MKIAGDILWYRGFHDVPRVFCVASQGATYVFESRFLDERDDYDDEYEVKRVEGGAAEPDIVLSLAVNVTAVARVPVSAVVFDPTRRRSMRVDL